MRARSAWRRGVGSVVAAVLLTFAQTGAAQTIRSPLPTTPLAPSIDRLNQASTRPLPQVSPSPTAPSSQVWVPDRFIMLPGVAGQVFVPGHFERPLPSGEIYVPPSIGRTEEGGVVVIPGTTRPPQTP